MAVTVLVRHPQTVGVWTTSSSLSGTTHNKAAGKNIHSAIAAVEARHNNETRRGK